MPAATPLSWQVEKCAVHADRLMNNLLPADFPHEVERGTAGAALAALAALAQQQGTGARR